ncbi:MAG: hypothetical protein JWQ27_2442 [Ferruginibacter sp.]|nr:hypothetical protein [Ferruginibacter sp.]
MLDLILLFFLARHMGQEAKRKGESATRWIWYTIGAWLGGEFLGLVFGVIFFGIDMTDYSGLIMFGLICAVGGYLIVRAQLKKIPEPFDDDINNIGNGL